MPDNKDIRRPEDNARIDIHDPQEVRNWCKSLNCTEAQLKAAVTMVGTSAQAVRTYLQK